MAWYTFEEGQGGRVLDRSGNGNDGILYGKAEWIGGAGGPALKLDGQSAYIDFGVSETLGLASARSVMIWFKPRAPRGGLVNWSTGSGWNSQRLVLAIDNHYNHRALVGFFSDGVFGRPFERFDQLKEDEWLHMAFTLDGRDVCIYRNGLLSSREYQPIEPNTAGVPLWIGRSTGLGPEYFDGLIGEVRIYNRALTSGEILALYREAAAGKGTDANLVGLDTPRLSARLYPAPAKIVATVDLRGIGRLPEGARCRVTLLAANGEGAPVVSEQMDFREEELLDFILNVPKPTAGSYAVEASLVGPDGARIGETSRIEVAWPGTPAEFGGVKVLNNFVWELLRIQSKQSEGTVRSFTLPRDRWVFVQSRANANPGARVRVGIDLDDARKAMITHETPGDSTHEAMGFFKAGEHKLHIDFEGSGELTRLIVRAVPMLQYAYYGAEPVIAPYGPYDWSFLQKHVLANINTMIGRDFADPPELERWKETGRHWITHTGVPRVTAEEPAGVDAAFKFWSEKAGIRNPLMDGIIIDEFWGGDQRVYDVYRKAVERIYGDPKYERKMVMPYGGRFYGRDRSTEFAKACIKQGGSMCWERYLAEQPTGREAMVGIYRHIVREMSLWEQGFSDAPRYMTMVLGVFSTPTLSLNTDPSVNFKVYMDMQMNSLATHPELFGLGGIQQWQSAFADEETLRWIGRLYRHYCIEGNTEPLAHDPYELTHIRNPDFSEGTAGWAIAPADPDSVAGRTLAGYSWLQGRFPRTKQGDSFLWMKRSPRKPNTFSQKIRDLVPGRLYSMKMITGDYQDLVQERSRKEGHALSIGIEGARMLTDPKSSFQFTHANGNALGKYKGDHHYWMNYHWRVFRAESDKAILTVSDWADEKTPGGPAGQELIYNFIEIQPYLESEV